MKAKSISEFFNKAQENCGYYIGRYEAGDGLSTESRANEKEGTLVVKKEQYVYNFISQPNASEVCKNMYNSDAFFSDLINSYAWDTAILFIQTFSENNKYSRQNSLNTSMAKTGTSGDDELNISDLAGNIREWTTELYSNPNYPCTSRGAYYDYTESYASRRYGHTSIGAIYNIGFRPIIYLK